MSTCEITIDDFYINFRSHSKMTTIATLEERVGNHIKFFWGVSAVFAVWLAGISVALYNMNGTLGSLNRNISEIKLPQQIEQVSLRPQEQQSQDEVVSLLRQAKQSAILLPEPVIQRAGTRFIGAANVNPAAWDTAANFLNYRSYLNDGLAPKFQDNEPLTPHNLPSYYINFTPLPPPPAKYFPPGTKIFGFLLWAHGTGAPPEKSAIMEKISKPVQQGGSFEAYIFNALKGTITLDDERMKNVFIYNAVIEYNGGQVSLENVYFVNCVFRIRYTPNGSHLGEQLLVSVSTTFSALS